MIGNNVDLQPTKSVYSVFKKVSDGAHGNTLGTHGSLTPCSLHKVLSAVHVYGRTFLDLGAGNGIVLAAALTNGATNVHGIELPENQANQYIFNAAMRKIAGTVVHKLPHRACLEFEDIEKVLLASFTKRPPKYNSFSEINRCLLCQLELR